MNKEWTVSEGIKETDELKDLIFFKAQYLYLRVLELEKLNS